MPFDDNSTDLTPHIGSPLAGLGPETIKKIALQSRPLTPNESDIINKAFKGSINPSDMRIAFDRGMNITNVRGYVIGKDLPTVMFFPANANEREISENSLHEATHVWQNLTDDRYTSLKGVPARNPSKGRSSAYAYDTDAAENLPLTEFGGEQQAEMVSNNAASARAFVQKHGGRKPNAGDMAFLDSVRSRYETYKKEAEPARVHAQFDKAPFSEIDWSKPGGPDFKKGNVLQPKMGRGDHNVVLENLRTKFPAYRKVGDGPLLAALLHRHPDYAQHVGPQGLRIALESGHKPNGKSTQ